MMKRTSGSILSWPASCCSLILSVQMRSVQLRASPTLRCQSWPLTPWCYPDDNANTSFGTVSVGMAIYKHSYDETRRSSSHSVIQILTFTIRWSHTHVVPCMGKHTHMHKNKLEWTLAWIFFLFQMGSMPAWTPCLTATSSSLVMGAKTRVQTRATNHSR